MGRGDPVGQEGGRRCAAPQHGAPLAVTAVEEAVLIEQLPQHCCRVEVDARRGDLPLRRVVLVDPATGDLDASTGCRAAGEWTTVFGCESPFDDHDASPEDPVPHEVAIPGKADDEGPYKLLAKRGFPLHEGAGNLDRHVVRIVGHDAVLVRPSPRLKVLVDERFDVHNGCECGGSCHDSSFRTRRRRPSRRHVATVDSHHLTTEGEIILSPGRGTTELRLAVRRLNVPNAAMAFPITSSATVELKVATRTVPHGTDDDFRVRSSMTASVAN